MDRYLLWIDDNQLGELLQSAGVEAQGHPPAPEPEPEPEPEAPKRFTTEWIKALRRGQTARTETAHKAIFSVPALDPFPAGYHPDDVLESDGAESEDGALARMLQKAIVESAQEQELLDSASEILEESDDRFEVDPSPSLAAADLLRDESPTMGLRDLPSGSSDVLPEIGEDDHGWTDDALLSFVGWCIAQPGCTGAFVIDELGQPLVLESVDAACVDAAAILAQNMIDVRKHVGGSDHYCAFNLDEDRSMLVVWGDGRSELAGMVMDRRPTEDLVARVRDVMG